jgi:hypothetical protein
MLGHQRAYVSHFRGGSLATAAEPESNTIIAAMSRSKLDDAIKALRDQQMEVAEGAWSTDENFTIEKGLACDAYVAAVAYQSGENRPGVWMDSYSFLPTEVQVLRAMHEEFRATGELSEVSFEEFVRLANPTVAIISPAEVVEFCNRNDGLET